MRYGGCVKEEYSDDWTCQQIFGPDSTLDVDNYMDGIRALDDPFRVTLAGLKAELLSMLLMVEGADEIINGFVVFFGNIGFEKKRFEAPLRKLVRDPINLNNLVEFVKSLLVDNELTRRLSHATSKFLNSVYETKKESETSIIFLDLMKYGCGLVYPIANYVFPKSDVDSVYDAVARGLESTQSGPVDDLSELQVEGLMWYLHLLHMQVVQHDPTKSKPIYQAVAKIIDDYKKMYPEFVVPRIVEIFGKETRKYVKVSSESFLEKRKFAELHKKFIVPNVMKHFEEIGDAKINEWMAKRFWGLHEVNRAFEEWLTRGKNNYADWTLTKLAEDMRGPIEKAWENGDLGAYSPKYCEHHLCAKNLCNLHGSLKLAKSETQHQEL